MVGRKADGLLGLMEPTRSDLHSVCAFDTLDVYLHLLSTASIEQ